MSSSNVISNPLLDQSPVATLVTRPDGTVLYANPAFASLLGVECASLPGCLAPDFFDNAAQRLFIQEKLRRPGVVMDHEVWARRADGSHVWVSLSIRRFDWQGEAAHLATLVEIGELLRAEDKLRKNEEKFRRFAEAATEGLALHKQGKILEANGALAVLWGCADPAELTGKNLADLVAPEARADALKHLKASAGATFETTALRKDGASMVLEISTRPCDYQGKRVQAAALRLVRQDQRALPAAPAPQEPQAQPQEQTQAAMPADADRRVEARPAPLDTPPAARTPEDRGKMETEKRLREQTLASLERRCRQVRLITEAAKAIAAATDLDDLYSRLVAEVNDQLGYYHTQILILEPNANALVLAKGYGQAGKEMLAAGHQMPLGAGLIGKAAESGQTVLRPDVHDDPDWQPNPLLGETRGEIAVPIKLGDRVLGVLDVQSSQAHALGADDQLVLEGLAGQIATAIENTRLRQDVEARLFTPEAPDQPASRPGLQAYGPMRPAGYRYTQADVLPLDAQWAAAVEQAFAQRAPAPLPQQEEGSVRALPLTVRGGEVIGTLGVLDRPGQPLSPDDLNLVEQVSDQVALALDSARLFEQAQKRAAELEAVAEVSTAASTLLEAEKLLKAVAQLTRELFDLYHAQVYLLEPELGRLGLAAGSGQVGRQMLAQGWGIPLDAKRSLIARAARQRRAVVVNDVHAEPDFLPHPLLPETRSEMAVPLIVGDDFLGIFDVQSDRTGRFTAVDEQIYTTLAAQVAVALQNANLYAEQSATVERLRELDQLKSAFLANMSHELRTPLNSVLGFAQVILEGLDGPLTDNMQSDLRLIEKNGQHLLKLINDVLDMAKIEAGRLSLTLEQVNIREMLEEVLETAGSLARNKGLYLELDEAADAGVVLKIDRIRIHQVILNLVGNALKFTEEGGVRVHVVRVDSRVQLRFSDTGIGIPPDKLESIFEAFSQVDSSTTRKVGGTGLGLPISRRLVELHGGRLWAESQGLGSGGSTFYLELPLDAETKPGS